MYLAARRGRRAGAARACGPQQPARRGWPPARRRPVTAARARSFGASWCSQSVRRGGAPAARWPETPGALRAAPARRTPHGPPRRQGGPLGRAPQAPRCLSLWPSLAAQPLPGDSDSVSCAPAHWQAGLAGMPCGPQPKVRPCPPGAPGCRALTTPARLNGSVLHVGGREGALVGPAGCGTERWVMGTGGGGAREWRAGGRPRRPRGGAGRGGRAGGAARRGRRREGTGAAARDRAGPAGADRAGGATRQGGARGVGPGMGFQGVKGAGAPGAAAVTGRRPRARGRAPVQASGACSVRAPHALAPVAWRFLASSSSRAISSCGGGGRGRAGDEATRRSSQGRRSERRRLPASRAPRARPRPCPPRPTAARRPARAPHLRLGLHARQEVLVDVLGPLVLGPVHHRDRDAGGLQGGDARGGDERVGVARADDDLGGWVGARDGRAWVVRLGVAEEAQRWRRGERARPRGARRRARAQPHPGHARLDERLAAGRRAAVVVAGLQGHVRGRAARGLAWGGGRGKGQAGPQAITRARTGRGHGRRGPPPRLPPPPAAPRRRRPAAPSPAPRSAKTSAWGWPAFGW
jgi:hypothetical protein